MVSGGFDPLHSGHVEYIRKAAFHGEVIVALNSDSWLAHKKGRPFMEWNERAAILGALKWVNAVVSVEDADGTVCEAIKRIRPDYFAKGGDRMPWNTPEAELCEELKIPVIYGLGEKLQSSSELVEKSWGAYEVLREGPGYKVKILKLKPGKSTSLQSHGQRCEHWIFPKTNEYRFVTQGEKHQLSAGDEELTVIEVQTGYCSEDDIVRYP